MVPSPDERKQRATIIARRGVNRPGMLSAGEISEVCAAFLDVTGTAEKHKQPEAEPAPAKASKPKLKKGRNK